MDIVLRPSDDVACATPPPHRAEGGDHAFVVLRPAVTAEHVQLHTALLSRKETGTAALMRALFV